MKNPYTSLLHRIGWAGTKTPNSEPYSWIHLVLKAGEEIGHTVNDDKNDVDSIILHLETLVDKDAWALRQMATHLESLAKNAPRQR